MLFVRNFSNVSLKGIWWVVPKQLIKKVFKQWSVEIVRVYMCIWIYFVNWYLFFIYYRNRYIVLLYMYKQVIIRFRFKCLQFSTFIRVLLLWKSSVIVLVVWVQIKLYGDYGDLPQFLYPTEATGHRPFVFLFHLSLLCN